jgi:hypothetical protein
MNPQIVGMLNATGCESFLLSFSPAFGQIRYQAFHAIAC